jgi:predicted MFS family arabinose efflux permease
MAEMVSKTDLANAVALNSASFNAAHIVGPAIGGCSSRVGVAPAFVLNAVGLLIVTVARPSGRRRRGGARPCCRRSAKASAPRAPMIRMILGLLLTVSITVFNFTVYVPLLARQVLGLGAEGSAFS